MRTQHKVALHALKSVRSLFFLLLLALVLIDVLAPYVSLGWFTLFMVTVTVLIPGVVSVIIAHSVTPEMYYLPAVIIFISGVTIVTLLALGCDVGYFTNSCTGGLAGPLVVLGVMFSWAGITFAVGMNAYKHMLHHGKIK